MLVIEKAGGGFEVPDEHHGTIPAAVFHSDTEEGAGWVRCPNHCRVETHRHSGGPEGFMSHRAADCGSERRDVRGKGYYLLHNRSPGFFTMREGAKPKANPRGNLGFGSDLPAGDVDSFGDSPLLGGAL